ncbi:MAG: TetR/AcrR family transcriptional regulator [Candidatus Tenebribacter burtonii]|nr:TetR/AcrR family transcriptional regulator [Candidatus Tenebribacter burtonii]
MKTKEKILRAGLELFLKKGYDKTSMVMIADFVGIQKASLYHHFKNKEDLAVCVIDYYDEKMIEWSREQNKTISTFEDFLHSTIISIPKFRNVEDVILGKEICDEVTMGFNDFVLALARENHEVKNKIKAIFQKTQNFVKTEITKAQQSGIIRNDIDAGIIAVIIHSVIEGAGVISSFDDEVDHEVFQKMYEELLKLLAK